MKKPPILILAAGRSSRMGQPKQLLPFQEKTLLGTVIEYCLRVNTSKVYCVLGAHASEIEKQHRNNDVQFVYNPSYLNGLSTSIYCGVREIIQKEPEALGILVILGDQPFITTPLINEYFNVFSKNYQRTVATAYDTNFGVPTIFPKKYFDKLQNLCGDSGAKELLHSIPDMYLMQPPAWKLMDIDTEEAYRQALKYTAND